MEMEKGQTFLRGGVNCSPGGLTQPIQAAQATTVEESNTTHETTGHNVEQMRSKTSECLFTWYFLSSLE